MNIIIKCFFFSTIHSSILIISFQCHNSLTLKCWALEIRTFHSMRAREKKNGSFIFKIWFEKKELMPMTFDINIMKRKKYVNNTHTHNKVGGAWKKRVFHFKKKHTHTKFKGEKKKRNRATTTTREMRTKKYTNQLPKWWSSHRMNSTYAYVYMRIFNSVHSNKLVL